MRSAQQSAQCAFQFFYCTVFYLRLHCGCTSLIGIMSYIGTEAGYAYLCRFSSELLRTSSHRGGPALIITFSQSTSYDDRLKTVPGGQLALLPRLSRGQKNTRPSDTITRDCGLIKPGAGPATAACNLKV